MATGRSAQGQSNILMLYQGQQQDPESNLYYLRARYYDPFTGCFISRDPLKGTLANPQSQNSYAYAGNNPINNSDPSGKIYVPGVLFVGGGLTLAGLEVGGAIYGAATSCGNPVQGAIVGAQNAVESPVGQAALSTATFGMMMANTPQSNQEGLELSEHAAQRMTQRGIDANQVQNTINNSQPFTYLHEGVIKTGFYDPITKIFVGTYNNQVTTIISDVSQNYINNLINGK